MSQKLLGNFKGKSFSNIVLAVGLKQHSQHPVCKAINMGEEWESALVLKNAETNLTN